MTPICGCSRSPRSPPAAPDPEAPEADSERTGVFTTGVVARTGEHDIALYFTGRQYAGENLRDLLKQRSPELSAPIQMSDALSRNVPKEFATILANCNCHGRRQFVDLVETQINAFDYLTALARNPQPVREHPDRWLPWNYQTALAELNSS